MRTSSTASAEPEAIELRCDPPYLLRDEGGRQRLLDEWTAMAVALDRPVQIWHGPRTLNVDVPGDGEAARLPRHLAASAHARYTVLLRNQPPAHAAVEVRQEARDHVRLADGRVARVIALIGWPAALNPNWLSDIAEDCAAVMLHLRPVQRPLAAKMLRRRLSAVASTSALDEQAGRLTDPDLAVAAETAEALRDALARGTTQLLQVQVLLGVEGDDLTALDATTAWINDTLAALVASTHIPRWQQAPAWKATQPGGFPINWPWRLLDAASVAATIPHPVGPDISNGGVLAGIDPASEAPLLVDRFSLHNPSRLVVGTSGAGKSYAAKLELMRHLVAGASGVVIDPEGEFGGVSDVLGGLTLAVGEEPAGLDPVGLACQPRLAASDGLSVLASWATALLGEPLTAVDLALLDRALAILRADKPTAVTAGDLLASVMDIAAHPPFTGADLAARLAPAAAGSVADLFAPNPDLNDPPDLVVFDLRAVSERVRPAVMACVLAWSWWQTMAADIERRRLVVVDEAHLLLDDPPAAGLLAQFARRARKYGVALEIVTQRLSDFLGHPSGEAVLANAATKLLLGCEDHERAAVATGLGLTDAEAELLQPGQRGSGLLITPTMRTPVHIVGARAEHELASSGPRR
jgi:type IV secretory pathway VirB4 component